MAFAKIVSYENQVLVTSLETSKTSFVLHELVQISNVKLMFSSLKKHLVSLFISVLNKRAKVFLH